MNNTKYIWGGILIAIVIAIIGIFLPQSVTKTVTNTVKGIYSTNFTALGLGVNDQYVQMSGIRQNLTSATTTPCTILSPNSTTSLDFADLNLTVGTSTAGLWTLAYASVPNATTTKLMSYTVASGALASIPFYASSSPSNVIPPSNYVTWGVQGFAIADPTLVVGTCQAKFVQI
jgi:hypothetical protein